MVPLLKIHTFPPKKTKTAHLLENINNINNVKHVQHTYLHVLYCSATNT